MSTATRQEEYRGRLTDLMPVLTRELTGKRPGTWVWRHLRGGALVSLMQLEDGRRVLRIARAARLANRLARHRWEQEVAIFLRHLGAEQWTRLPSLEDQGAGVVALFGEST